MRNETEGKQIKQKLMKKQQTKQKSVCIRSCKSNRQISKAAMIQFKFRILARKYRKVVYYLHLRIMGGAVITTPF